MSDIAIADDSPEVLMSESEANNCVSRIQKCAKDLWKSMLAFHNGRGWIALGYTNPESCAKKEFGFSGTHLYRMMAASIVVADIRPRGGFLPTEMQCRTLKKLAPEDRDLAWSAASDMAKESDNSGVVTPDVLRVAITSVSSTKKDTKEEDPKNDPLGPVLSDPVKKALDGSRVFNTLVGQINETLKSIESLSKQNIGQFIRIQEVTAELKNAARHMRHAAPKAPCPYCAQKGCKTCRDAGWVPKGIYDAAPDEMK